MGKGIKKMNSWGYGDHYIHVKVKNPRTMTAHHLQLLYGIAMNIGEKDIDSAKYYQEPPKTEATFEEPKVEEPASEEKQTSASQDDLKEDKTFKEVPKQEEGFLDKENNEKSEKDPERKKSCG